MTLVAHLEESSGIERFTGAKQHLVSMMLSVQPQAQQQQQQQQQQLYHLAHRGNVIVTANNNNNNDSKMQQVQQQSAAQKRKMYAQATPYSGSSTGQAPHQPASVARRNARERNRVKQVNNGFATLRQHIPQSLAQALGGNTAGTQGGARAGSKKLSKVETLRMAVEYIRNLQQLLDENDSEAGSSSSGSPSPQAGSPGQSALEHQQPEIVKFELKSESGDDELTDMQHHYQHQHLQYMPQQQQQQYQQLQRQQSTSPIYIAAPCSEASSSPTPSFVSEASSTGGSQGYGTNFTAITYSTHQDGYDGCEPMSPEDEELLDYISMWQQGQ